MFFWKENITHTQHSSSSRSYSLLFFRVLIITSPHLSFINALWNTSKIFNVFSMMVIANSINGLYDADTCKHILTYFHSLADEGIHIAWPGLVGI